MVDQVRDLVVNHESTEPLCSFIIALALFFFKNFLIVTSDMEILTSILKIATLLLTIKIEVGNKMTSISTRSISYAAIGAALIATLSQISVPIGPVPFTLQTLAIGLIATLYKPKEAAASVGIYLTLGAVGLPVFAGGSGGFQALFGATGGFLWAFLVYAIVTANLTRLTSSVTRIFLANCLGVALVLLGGASYFKLFSGTNWSDTFTWTVTPFILTGILKIVVVILIVKALQPILKKEAYFQ